MLTGAVFVFFFLWALLRPYSLSHVLGYQLESQNSRSEFHAIYVGVFLAQALLSTIASANLEIVILGDLVAFFVLAQPLGRLIALFRNGFPQKLLRSITISEIIGGTLLLLIRPEVSV